MQARGTIELSARTTAIPGDLAEVFARQIGMWDDDRSIDQPDLQPRAPATAFHQRRKLDQLQGIHKESSGSTNFSEFADWPHVAFSPSAPSQSSENGDSLRRQES
jgi:hypothetical protein